MHPALPAGSMPSGLFHDMDSHLQPALVERLLAGRAAALPALLLYLSDELESSTARRRCSL
jgi:hypothetical protein